MTQTNPLVMALKLRDFAPTMLTNGALLAAFDRDEISAIFINASFEYIDVGYIEWY
jgi:hypothetical protein